MKHKAVYLLVGLIVVIGAIALIRSDPKPASPPLLEAIVKPEFAPLAAGELIAHAGGGIEDLIYTNSLEALNLSVRNGFKYIEIDLLPAVNGDLILLHDWKDDYIRLFSSAPGAGKNAAPRRKKPVRSAAEFKSLIMTRGLTQMDLKDLVRWMSEHPQIFIVTDIKGDNIEGLRKIRELSGDVQSRFIPQIYKFDQYKKVKALGFEKAILTAYRLKLPPEELGEFCRDNDLFALTVPKDRIKRDTFERLGKIDTPVFVHTINSAETASELVAIGVSGVYTDFLYPDKLSPR